MSSSSGPPTVTTTTTTTTSRRGVSLSPPTTMPTPVVGARVPLWTALSPDHVVAALHQQRAWRMLQEALTQYAIRWKRSQRQQLEAVAAAAAAVERPAKRARRSGGSKASSKTVATTTTKTPKQAAPRSGSAATTATPTATSTLSLFSGRRRNHYESPPLILALCSGLPAERRLVARRLLHDNTRRELLQAELKHLVVGLYRTKKTTITMNNSRWMIPQWTMEWISLLLESAKPQQPVTAAAALESANQDIRKSQPAATATNVVAKAPDDDHNKIHHESSLLVCSRADVVEWTRLVHDCHDPPDRGTVAWLTLLQHVLLNTTCSSERDLQVAQFRHRAWLWNTQLLLRHNNNNTIAVAATAEHHVTTDDHHGLQLSPLACLLKTYYQLSSSPDVMVSRHQVALQQCQIILQKLVDPTLQPTMKQAEQPPKELRKESIDDSQVSMEESYNSQDEDDADDIHKHGDEEDDLMEVIMDQVAQAGEAASIPFGALMDIADAEGNDDDVVMSDADEQDDDDNASHDDDAASEDDGEKEVADDADKNDAEMADTEKDGNDKLIVAAQEDLHSSDDDSEHDEGVPKAERKGENVGDNGDHDHYEDDEDHDDDDDEEDRGQQYILTGDEDEEEQMAFLAGLNSRSRILGAMRSRREAAKAVEVVLPPEGLTPSLDERISLIVVESMQVLAALYPPHSHQHASSSGHQPVRRPNYLSIPSELAMLNSINNYVQPPKKPDTTKIIMRRAPTQEEFFGGSLSRNPIPVSILKPSTAEPSYEPTVADLRQHIADDLQMSDSAELIEILVANKIVGVQLKLRVVHQVLWREHLMENSTASSTIASGGSFLSASGLSMIFNSGLGNERLQVARFGGGVINADTPLSALPSMMITYRLAGVDGEATEDTVNSLTDPEAPSEMNPEEREKLLEDKFIMTRLVTSGRGIHVLMRSVQHAVADCLRRIRRDNVGGGVNLAREQFQLSSPASNLILLRHCCQLQSNRKLLLSARAPTLLLTLLLDVLKTLEECSLDASGPHSPTADILQELIESLTSDISVSGANAGSGTGGAVLDEQGYDSEASQDSTSMALLLESIETISLSPPLRQVIGKLLPFLTYGQADLSRTLAEHFVRNIVVERLSDCEAEETDSSKSSILMDTFVQTAMSLPCNEVCNPLRTALIKSGFIERLTCFISEGAPEQPPPWSAALWSKGEILDHKANADGQQSLEERWRDYFVRSGIRTAFKIITGLCKVHGPTQSRVASSHEFIQFCHWIEATLDNDALDISTGGLGLLAETLLDEIAEANKKVRKVVEKIRMKTRMRKKELAEERRNITLQKMTSSFGPLPGTSAQVGNERAQPSAMREAAASLLAPVIGLFRESSSSNSGQSASAAGGSSPSSSLVTGKEEGKPTWLTEMENMEEDDGLTCAVCQEGLTLQPSQLLGLYAYVKKVTISSDQGGSRQAIDGTLLLKALPPTLPENLAGDPLAEEWFLLGRAASDSIPASDTSASVSSSRKHYVYTTTVSAGNAIHFTCHHTARQADRNHAKAPKTEWEGATLRNSRVSCNLILPVVSCQNSKVSLLSVDSSLSAHQTAITNLLGSVPKSMLWDTLHDTRFLLLRMAYGESLSADSGGGSLSSNCQLLFYQILMAEMLDKGTESNEPSQSKHVRALPCGFLAALSMMASKDSKDVSASLTRGVADSAPMAALTSIAFHNNPSKSAASGESIGPYPKRMWLLGRDYFLRGLLICAGRRHALHIDGSGCQSARGGLKRARTHSFADWDVVEADNVPSSPEPPTRRSKSTSRRTKASISDFQNALRPMITLYAIFDQLSVDFSADMTDVLVEEAVVRLVAVIEGCQRAKNIHELLESAKIAFDPDEMVDLLQKGMLAA